MDTALALIGDLKAANILSKNSKYVAQSRTSPHRKRMMKEFEFIAKRNNYLSKDEIDQLQRKRNSLYERSVIGSINTIDELDYANEETVTAIAIGSKYQSRMLEGTLSIGTTFSKPIIAAIEDSFYGNTTGLRKREDGSIDHTAKRTSIVSTDEKISTLGGLSMSDKRRLNKAIEVVNQSESDDPFDNWVIAEANRKLAMSQKRATRELNNVTKGSQRNSKSSDDETIDWNSLLV